MAVKITKTCDMCPRKEQVSKEIGSRIGLPHELDRKTSGWKLIMNDIEDEEYIVCEECYDKFHQVRTKAKSKYEEIITEKRSEAEREYNKIMKQEYWEEED